MTVKDAKTPPKTSKVLTQDGKLTMGPAPSARPPKPVEKSTPTKG